MENRASHFSARHSISRRFSYALIGVVTLTLFSFAAIVISINLSRVNTDLKIQLDDTLALAQKSLVEPLWNFDQNTVDRFVEALFLDESVVYVKISDDAQVISTRIRAPFENKDVSYFEQASQFIVQSTHINHEDNRIGTVQIAMSRDSFKEALVSNIQSIIVLTVLIIISISLTSIFISRRYISRPLSKLQHSTALIAKGDLDAVIDISSKDEIGGLAYDLNVTRDSIKRLVEALRTSNRKLEDANQTLEQRVEERTVELERAMQDAQEVRVVAEAANRAKSAFLANMSHELRTPLNAILGFSQLMDRDKGLSEQQRENLGVIGRSGEHLLALINDVLEISKIEAGQTMLNEKSFDLYRLLDGLEEMFQLRAKDKGLGLLFGRAPEVPQYVRTDEGKLRQVLMNLLSNAIKFSSEGGVSLRAGGDRLSEFSPEKKGASEVLLAFEVEDTGMGIASEELEMLFEAFAQTASGLRTQEGTGLGLPISQEYVQLMGGEITVNSQVGKGSIFKFSVEVVSVEAAEVRTEKPARRVVGLAHDQPRYRILVVEDRLENRLLMVNLLRPLGFEVREAENGQEGIAVWREWAPHLVWMDMRMPVMDGYEATRRIKEMEKGQETVVIALTASAFEEDRTRILSLGCDGFVRKPFREKEVFDAMAQHLGVEFVYEEEEEAVQTPSGSREALTPEALSGLPGEWVAQLHEAASQADEEMVMSLIEQIEGEHDGLARGLRELVGEFQFGKIIALAG